MSDFTLGTLFGVFLVFAGHGLAIYTIHLRNKERNK
jgi:uncharacterized membrane protein HdeD (DUF308 family)